MLLSSDELKASIDNWEDVALHVFHRMRADLAASRVRDARDDEMLQHAIAATERLHRGAAAATRPPSILAPVRFRRDGLALDLFTTITTLGTPLDITLQELRIETMFPASPRDRDALDVVMKAE